MALKNTKRLKHPHLCWEHGILRSKDYKDIYFSEENGLEESRQVFLKGIGFEQACTSLSGQEDRFVIGELGFGTGLNFLACWDLWRKKAPPSSSLHYYSVEGSPLSCDSVRKALMPFQELSPLKEQLFEVWPTVSAGFHRIRFSQESVVLNVLHLDVIEALKSLQIQADAWFLDGFSPRHNPEMWSDRVFKALSEQIKPGGRLASFSVAASVREGLTRYGFQVEKKPGYLHKKHRLEGIYIGKTPCHNSPFFPRGQYRKTSGSVEKKEETLNTPSFQSFPERKASSSLPSSCIRPFPPSSLSGENRGISQTLQKDIVIIGDGIAGAALVYAFRQRGIEVTLVSPPLKRPALPAALIMPKLDLQNRAETRFFTSAYLYALEHYQRISNHRLLFSKGIYKIAKGEEEQQQFRKYIAQGNLPETHCRYSSLEEINDHFGNTNAKSAIFFPQALLLHPEEVLNTLYTGCKTLTASIESIQPTSCQTWKLYTSQDECILETPICILAAGYKSFSIIGQEVDFLQACRGQLSLYPQKAFLKSPLKKAILEKKSSIRNKAASCYRREADSSTIQEKFPEDNISQVWPAAVSYSGGYAMQIANSLIIGTTHKEGNSTLSISDTEKNEIYQCFQEIFPERARSLSLEEAEGYTGVRATTPDRFPVVGPLHDPEVFSSDFSGLKMGHPFRGHPEAKVLKGLYTLTGLGSHGFTLAFLLAESLVADILDEPSPLEHRARYALHPFRFLVRSLKRQGKHKEP